MAGDSFDSIPIPDWVYDWINPKQGATGSNTGLQKAHTTSASLWDNLPQDAKDAFAELDQFGIGANYTSNAELFPETQRGGVVFGTTVHNGRQVAELDAAQFDPLEQRATFMNEQVIKLKAVDEDLDLSPAQKIEEYRSIAREQALPGEAAAQSLRQAKPGAPRLWALTRWQTFRWRTSALIS